MEVTLAAFGHKDQDGASRFSPVQQRLTPPALLYPSLLRPSFLHVSRCPGFVEELTKEKFGVYVEICSSIRDENPWAFPTPSLCCS
ncbi:unnamed protein product [Arabis nemorensis]|uniref:Uncharacterized protein n=1 Tax=Arabis nemorensis TaxID=586526 RepID=A0A565CRB3_9BRAS|nr:unnamed protein product [Arabis nemorensis]